MPVVDSWPLFGLNADFLQCRWIVTAVQIYCGYICNDTWPLLLTSQRRCWYQVLLHVDCAVANVSSINTPLDMLIVDSLLSTCRLFIWSPFVGIEAKNISAPGLLIVCAVEDLSCALLPSPFHLILYKLWINFKSFCPHFEQCIS